MPHRPPPAARHAAFTLFEVAIVITIIALLVGGTLLGQSLIRNAQLNAVVAEEQQYVQAMVNFRNKYLALPGDFGGSVSSTTTGAAALWGSIATTAANCRTTTRTTATNTCNGNGDGKIGEYSDTNSNYEQFTAWEHLRNAGFANVNVNGLMTATYNKTPGTNVPASRLTGAGWGISWLSQSVAATQAIATTNDTLFRHVLWLGGKTATTTNQTNPVLTAAEALALDKKIDDGYANSGAIVAQTNFSGTACTSSGQYSGTTSALTCSLVFKTGF